MFFQKHLGLILIIGTLLIGVSLSLLVSQWFKQEVTKFNVKRFGFSCRYEDECNHLVAVNCHANAGGPYLFVNKMTREIVEYCGRYCAQPSEEKYCQNCPPKEWDCY